MSKKSWTKPTVMALSVSRTMGAATAGNLENIFVNRLGNEPDPDIFPTLSSS